MKQLTPMEEFAMNHIRENGETNPNWLASVWYEYKNGRLSPAASRARFGTTSAAYRTLRNLEAAGLIKSSNDYEFKVK